MVVHMLAIPSASTPATLRLRASATRFRRIFSIALWFSTSFRPIGMSTGQPRSSLATSSYAKLCSKDLKKSSQEVSQAIDEVGFEKDLVCLKDDDRLMKLTMAELRGLMRKLGIPPTGRKQDLIQALKSFSGNKTADQNSENSIPKGAESCLSKITPDQPRNQGRRGKVKSLLVSSLKDSLTSARSGVDNDGKLHVTGKKARNCKKQFNNNKQSIDVIAQSSSPQKETTVERHLMISASQVCEAQTIDSVDGCSEEGNMPLPLETDKGPACKKRKVMKTVHNSKIKDGIAAGEAEQKINFEEPWTMLVHKKLQDGWVAYNPTTMRVTSPVENANMIRLISWNVNGLRALLKRKEENPILQLAEREKFDVLCLQETKLQEKDVEQIKKGLLDGYENSFWTCSVSKLGYSGTSVISRIKPVSVKFGLGIQDHDGEGRLITIEFDRFYLVAGYVPNSGQKLERLMYRVQQWDPALSSYIKDLEQKKPVVLTGDLNCAHEEIDIYNPDGNHRSAGFTDEERKSFEDNYLNKGFVDSFRHKYPNTVGYTYWGYRQGARAYNRGWRLDYFLVSNAIVNNVYDSYILPDVNGSDHCPIGLILNL